MRGIKHRIDSKAFLRAIFETSRPWLGYTVAILGIPLAVLVRGLLQEAVGGQLLPFTLFYPVVFLAAVLGGTGPGLLATLLGGLSAEFYIVEPVRTVGFGTPVQSISFILFLLVNVGISLLGGRFHNRTEALLESESRLRLSQQIAHVGAFQLNVQTGENVWTVELESMYGLKPHQFAGTQDAWEALVHPEDRPKAVAAVARAFQTFRPEEEEWRVVWPDGSIHWLVGRFQAVRDRAGKPLFLAGVNLDVTDRKKAAESEQRFRAWTAGGAYAEYRMSADWAEMRELHGHNFIADTSAVNRDWLKQYIPKEEQARVMAVINEAIRTKSLFELEHRVIRADGRVGWTLSRAIPVQDKQGNVTEWFGAARDVTERKEAEEALRRREEWFRTMADSIPELAWICRPDGYNFWFNRRCFEYFGLTQEQLEGWAWLSVVDPEALPKIVERWKHSVATGEPFHDIAYMLRGRDGRFRPFLANVVPLKGQEGRVELWFGTAVDISELRERERALTRQARLIDLTPAATSVFLLDGTITFWSDGSERLYGWTRAEAIGRRIMDLLRTEFPEPRENIIAKLRAGGTWSGELKQYTRSGRPVIVESYWLAELNAQGQVDELLQSNTNITQRKHLQEHLEEVVAERTAELRKAADELEHMSYSMIHDMRAPLRAMQSFAYMLEEEVPDCRKPPGADYLQRIRQSSLRLDRLITDALNYSRLLREEAVLAPVDVGKLLHGMIDTYPNLQPRVADVSMEFDHLTLIGNEALLTQCFGNLLDNAVKFVALGVRPSVHVWAQELQSDSGPQVVRIWIEDNGIGIPANAQQKIFRLFQRMQPEGEFPGTGIGLAMVKKAVERMNGHVGFESQPGKGSRFWIELPMFLRKEARELVHA